MSELRKITASVPEKTLVAAQAYSGRAVTETLRVALERLGRQVVYDQRRALKDKAKFDDLREVREFDDHGDIE